MRQADDRDVDGFVAEFWRAWNSHDVETCVALFTDDGVFEPSTGAAPWGARYQGTVELRRGIETMFAATPDVHWDPRGHFACGDRLETEWRMHGTRNDGTRLDVLGIDIITLEGRRIASKRSFRKLHVS